MHDQAINFVRRVVIAKGLDTAKVNVLDIGGRKTSTSQFYNGPQPADLFKNAAYDVLDIEDGPDVTILADATRIWTLPPWTIDFFDVVVCTEVLEHVKDWVQVLETSHRTLKDNGTLILTCAGPGRRPHPATSEDLDPPPGEFYANVSHLELRKALEHVGFRNIVTYQTGHDTQATAVK